MLAPTKHTNIRFSVIYIAGKILKILNNEDLLRYDDLKNSIIADLGLKSKYNLDFALTFLYSIGKIRYIKEIDAIALIKSTNEN
jgi:hypothetical protein